MEKNGKSSMYNFCQICWNLRCISATVCLWYPLLYNNTAGFRNDLQIDLCFSPRVTKTLANVALPLPKYVLLPISMTNTFLKINLIYVKSMFIICTANNITLCKVTKQLDKSIFIEKVCRNGNSYQPCRFRVDSRSWWTILCLLFQMTHDIIFGEF